MFYEEAWLELYLKNASCFQQILEAVPDKTAAHVHLGVCLAG